MSEAILAACYKRALAESGLDAAQLPEAAFAETLRASVAHRFAETDPDDASLRRYLASLRLADLALACACRHGDERAWERFIAELRPILYRAGLAITGDDTGGRDLADSIYAEPYGKEARPDRPLLPDSWTQIRRLLHWPVLTPLAAGAVVVLAVWVISPGTTRDRGPAPATSPADGTAERPPERQRARQTPAVAIPAVRLDPADARAEESRAAIAPPTRVERLSSVDTVAVATNDTPPLVAQEALAPTGMVILPSPQDTLQWRAGSGTIARTDNGGLSWRVQLAVPEQVVAGAAPSASVAWLVGEGGLVLRTVDGEQWTRLPPPAIVSLIAVDATDGFRATVTTEDAGTTWTLLR